MKNCYKWTLPLFFAFIKKNNVLTIFLYNNIFIIIILKLQIHNTVTIESRYFHIQ